MQPLDPIPAPPTRLRSGPPLRPSVLRGWLAIASVVLLLLATKAAGQQLAAAPEALLLNTDAGSQSIQSATVTYTAEGGVVRDVSCVYSGDPALYIDLRTATGQAPDLLAPNGTFDVHVHCTAAAPGSYSGAVACTYTPSTATGATAGGAAQTVETVVDCDVIAGPAVHLGTAVAKANERVSVAIEYVASPAVGPNSIVNGFVAEIALGEGGLPLPDLAYCGGTLGGIDVVCSVTPQGSVRVETDGLGGPNLPSGSLGRLTFKVPEAVNVASSYALPVSLATFGPNQTQPAAVGNRSGVLYVTARGTETLAADPAAGMAVLAVAGARAPGWSSPLVASATVTAFGDIADLSCGLVGDVPQLTFGGLEATPQPPFLLSGAQQRFEVSCDRRQAGRFSDTVRCNFGGGDSLDIPVDCAVLQGPAIAVGSDVADPGQAAILPLEYLAGSGEVTNFQVVFEPPETPIGTPDLSACGGTLGDVTVTCSLGVEKTVILTAPASGSGASLPSGPLGSVTYTLPTTLATPYVFAFQPEAQFFDATANEVAAVGNETGHIGCSCGGDALVADDSAGPPRIDLAGTLADGVVTGHQSLLSVADLSDLSCAVAGGGDPQISLAPPANPLPSRLGAHQAIDLEARCLAALPGTYTGSLRCDYTSAQGGASSTTVPVYCVVEGGPAVQLTSAEIPVAGSAPLELSYIADPTVVSFEVEVVYDANFLAVGDLSACGGASALGVGVTCVDDGGVVRLTTDAAASGSLPDGSLGSITFDQVGPIQAQDLPLTLETGFNNQKFFDANQQELSPRGSTAGEILITTGARLAVQPSSLQVAGPQGTDPSAVAMFTVEAVQIPAGDLDCSLTGDPRLSAVSSYPFLAPSAPNLAQGNTFTVTFGCDTSSPGTFTGNYLCVAAGDGGADIEIDLPVSCTVS